MKRVLAAALLLSGFTSPAQTTGQSAVAHAPDGGTMERVQSISILPLINSPFTATVTTVWTKILPDGTTATMANRRTVARDSTGRIFQERRFFAPDGDKKPPRISSLEYADPNRHELYRCFPERKTCYLSTYFSSQMTQIPPGPLDSTPVPKGFTIQREVLGQKTIEDLDVTGSRQIVTLGAGVIGNQKPQPIVKEFWFSPRLGVNLVVKRFDPRAGSQDFTVSGINLNEPDPKLFEPSSDYQVLREVVVKAGADQGDSLNISAAPRRP